MNIKYYTNEQLWDAVNNPELLVAYRRACKEELESRGNFKLVTDDLY
jgi:hypothetical protein